MEISFNRRDKHGEIDIVFGVKVIPNSPVEQSDVEITDVCVNGSFAPKFLEEYFVKIIGREVIEELAVMKYIKERAA